MTLKSAQELLNLGKTLPQEQVIEEQTLPHVEPQLPEVVADEPSQMITTGDQKKWIVEFQNQQCPDTARANAFGKLIESQMEGIQAIMPDHMTFKRIKEIMVMQLKQTPKLLNCDPIQLMQAVYQAAALGLEPYSQMGEFYIIPFGRTPQVVIGFKGLRKLAMNSGELQSIETRCVYKNEADQALFKVEYGTNPFIYHKPIIFGKTGDLIGVYAIARFKDASLSPVMEFMSIDDIEHVKKSSKATGSGTPWSEHYSEMARKSVLRRVIKSLPLAVTPVTLVKALDMDNAHHNGQKYVIDVETGEAKATKQITNDVMDV